MRKTSQRQAIKEALLSNRRPLSPQEIHALAEKKAPGLGIATVYRAVKQLVDEGWLDVVEVPKGPMRYEVAGHDHCNHFYCRLCEGVFEVAQEPPDLQHLTPPGFHVEKHSLMIYGLCPRCAN